eukprot:620287_1
MTLVRQNDISHEQPSLLPHASPLGKRTLWHKTAIYSMHHAQRQYNGYVESHDTQQAVDHQCRITRNVSKAKANTLKPIRDKNEWVLNRENRIDTHQRSNR